jgi:hypothetical protein
MRAYYRPESFYAAELTLQEINEVLNNWVCNLNNLRTLRFKAMGLWIKSEHLLSILSHCHKLEEIDIGSMKCMLNDTAIDRLKEIKGTVRLKRIKLLLYWLSIEL